MGYYLLTNSDYFQYQYSYLLINRNAITPEHSNQLF